MDDYIQDLMKQYTKEEVLGLCGELSLTVSDNTKFSDVVQLLTEDLDREGIPESDDCSELMSDFLYVADYVDEDGNIVELDVIEEEEEEDAREPKIVPEAVKADEKLPECFGFHDERDPACRKCKVKITCETERVKTRPSCFGELYHKNNIQCKQCIERTFCKEVMNG